ncbi:MAG: hypothetical protein ACREQD_04710, partial [Candidatus Binataceae bacterium]
MADVVLAGLAALGLAGNAFATDSGISGDVTPIQRQLQKLKNDEAAERTRMQSDEKLIHALEQRLDQLDAHSHELQQNAGKLDAANHQLEDATSQKLQTLQEQLAGGVSPAQFDTAM